MQSLKIFTDAIDKKSSQTDMSATDDTATALGIVVYVFVSNSLFSWLHAFSKLIPIVFKSQLTNNYSETGNNQIILIFQAKMPNN